MNKTKKLMQAVVILLCLTMATPFKAWAQEAEPSERLTRLLKPGTSTVYSFNYPTVNSAGERIVLSSALVAWTPTDRQESDSIETLHIYSHATIGADEERPTSTGFSKEQIMLQTLPRRTYGDFDGNSADYLGRCIIIAPDYEGFGLTKDLPHPYLSQRLTAQQVLDAVNYGLELYRKQAAEKVADNPLLPFKSDWRTFGLGYSQGGAVTLAVQRLIEEKGLSEQLHYYGSVCGDGPYDLIETMRYYFDDDGTSYGTETDHRKGVCTYPVVVPLIIKGMCSTHPAVAKYSIEDYLSQQLIDTDVLNWIDSKEYTTSEMSKMWYDQLENGLYANDNYYYPEEMAEMFSSPKEGKVWGILDKMFTPATFAYLNNADNLSGVPSEPANAQEALHRALADNSTVTGWEPQHRIQFYHSRGDMVVPFGNYLAFRDAHPDGENTIYRIDDTFTDSDHMDAATLFFLQLCVAGSFASNYNWICEGVLSSGIDTQHITDDQRLSRHDDNWYTLDGRRLSSKPTVKGVYIHQRKKVVIK
ncbi:MAG: hypothetical protein IJ605_06270 [Prevotella sp.]|nr:hypothetical protein [Prevotella sp.]